MKFKRFFILFFFVFLLLNLILPAMADIFTMDSSSINSLSPVIPSIHRFAKIDNNYYRGGQPTDEAFQDLSRLGIKTIINLRLLDPKRDCKQKQIAECYGMNYLNIPLNPFTPPTDEQIKYFFSILDDPNNLPVFVYCWHGEDRTSVMTALYRIRYYNWNYDKAYAEMKSYGFHSLLFSKQKRFLRDYINSLNAVDLLSHL